MGQERKNDAQEYAVTIRERVEAFELALGGDREGVRSVLLDAGEDVGELFDEDDPETVTDAATEAVRLLLEEWPLEVKPTFHGWSCNADALGELVLVVTAGGPHCEVEVTGGQSVTVRAWWGGDVGVATLSAPEFASFWWELAECQIRAHQDRRPW